MKINIAITGGPCTGKSTLAASLFATLKEGGFDYDLVAEESRKLKREFTYQSPFDRFYIWRQQEREELRSCAADGFVTDTALYQYYVSARQHAKEPRDQLAVRELFRMCQELEVNNRYQLVVLAADPREIAFKTDQVRSSTPEYAAERHKMLRSFLEHLCPEKLLFVTGTLAQRRDQVLERMRLAVVHMAGYESPLLARLQVVR